MKEKCIMLSFGTQAPRSYYVKRSRSLFEKNYSALRFVKLSNFVNYVLHTIAAVLRLHAVKKSCLLLVKTMDASSSLKPKDKQLITEEEENNDIYHIKWIQWWDEKTPIITQNKNGPCPLLAIFNVLLLSKRVRLV